MACMLVVATLVARHLGPDAFGIYTLLVAFSGVLATVQVSIEGATIHRLSFARADDRAREIAFSTVVTLYLLAGLSTGIVTAAGGVIAVDLIHSSPQLAAEGRDAVFALAALSAIGWPLKATRDALRAERRFGQAALAEAIAFASVLTAIVVLVTLRAPLWTIAATGGSLAVLTGMWSFVIATRTELSYRFRPRCVSRQMLAELGRSARSLTSRGFADLAVYALDGVVLGLFRGTRTIGLYGGAARPENALRQLTGTLQLTVIPVASDYYANDDVDRIHELVVRGTRYVMAIVSPIAVALMILSGPLLEVWLGPRYRAGDTALAILSSYWIFAPGLAVGASTLIAARKLRPLVRYAWWIAVTNLVLSVVLTAWLGLVGVTLGTAIPYLLSYPYFARLMVRELPITFTALATRAWAPGLVSAGVCALLLVPVRIFDPPHDLIGLLAAFAVGLVAAWSVMWLVFLSGPERRLALHFLRHPLGKDSSFVTTT